MTHSWFPWSQEPAGDKLCQLSMTTENIHGVLSENCVDALLEHHNFVPGPSLGGQAQGAEGTCMQADAFPRTSSARNPIVIVKIFRARAGRPARSLLFFKGLLGGHAYAREETRMLAYQQTS